MSHVPFVEHQVHTGMSMIGLLALVASGFEDLAAAWECTLWWVVKIHCSCIDSPCPALQSQHLLVIMGNVYWYFRLRPHGIIEILCGEGSAHFVTILPKNVNREIVLELLVTVLPPPSLQYAIQMRLNGCKLHNRLIGLNNGFYLQVLVTGNYRLGRDILLTPYKLLNVLHVAPLPSMYRRAGEYYCYVPGRAFFLGCRCLVVRGDRRNLGESAAFSI